MYQFIQHWRHIGWRRISSVCSYLLLSTLLCSQEHAHTEPAVAKNSLDALVELALPQNPNLQAARTVLDAAKGRQEQSGRLDNPSLILGYASDRAFNAEGELVLRVGFAQKFPLTRRLELERSAAKDAILLAEVEIADAAHHLREKVEFAAYALTETLAEQALHAKVLELNRTWLGFIESRIERGEASEVDVNRLKLEIYSLEQEQQGLANRELLRRAELKRLCGLGMGETLDFDFEFFVPESPLDLPEMDAAILESHPEYRVDAQMLALATKNLELAKVARWADIEVEVYFQEERGVDAPGGLGRDRFFGVGLSIPLPLHNRSEGNVAEREAQRKRLEWQLLGTEARLRSEAATQRELVGRLHAQILNYRSEVTPTLDANIELMKTAYAGGQISLTDLFSTQAQSLHLQTKELQLLQQLAEALSNWQVATGLHTTCLIKSK